MHAAAANVAQLAASQANCLNQTATLPATHSLSSSPGMGQAGGSGHALAP